MIKIPNLWARTRSTGGLEATFAVSGARRPRAPTDPRAGGRERPGGVLGGDGQPEKDPDVRASAFGCDPQAAPPANHEAGDGLVECPVLSRPQRGHPTKPLCPGGIGWLVTPFPTLSTRISHCPDQALSADESLGSGGVTTLGPGQRCGEGLVRVTPLGGQRLAGCAKSDHFNDKSMGTWLSFASNARPHSRSGPRSGSECPWSPT